MSHDEDYFLPLEDQRVFGAGIRRKRVPFVRSSEHELNTTTISTSTASSTRGAGPSIADTYLSIVMPRGSQSTSTSTSTSTSGTASTTSTTGEKPEICEVCNLPLYSGSTTTTTTIDNKHGTKPHEASLAHQLCLTHSHPPSHLDRTRHGLRYLSSYGWDPDSRVGLGAPGREGIREPIKGRLKVDTVGLGAEGDDDDDAKGMKRREREKRIEKGRPTRVEKKLNAKEVRKGDLEARKREEKLKEMFYQREDVQKYLG